MYINITNFEKSSIVPVIFCYDGDDSLVADMRAICTCKIIHMCDLQHTCRFAHKND